VLTVTRRLDPLPRSGFALLALGLGWLAAQAWGVWPLSFAWTLYAIVPGLVCLIAVEVLGPRAAWLAATGAALVAVGLLLGALSSVNGWAAWPVAALLAGVAAPALGWCLAGWHFGRRESALRARQVAFAGCGLAALTAVAVTAAGLLGGEAVPMLAGVGPLLLIATGGALLLRP
jgi:hypothetical protein